MENPIPITMLNDYVFCPASIYFHQIDGQADTLAVKSEAQLNGNKAHEAVDEGRYSHSAHILQGMTVYSERYNLIGKIDMFDAEKGVLTERKRTIKTIYDGYVFQLYGQFYALVEMGYTVTTIRLHSLTDNKNYAVKLPNDDDKMLVAFEKVIDEIEHFQFAGFVQNNEAKCRMCVYRDLCCYTTYEE